MNSIRLALIWLLTMGYASVVLASSIIPRTFHPYADVFNENESSALEIVAKQTSFMTPYQYKMQSFADLFIPFEVRSKSEEMVSYRLSYPVFSHYCELNDEPTPINEVTIRLDNAAWPQEGGRFFDGALKREHVITLDYPVIELVSQSQLCYGTLGIQVELVHL